MNPRTRNALFALGGVFILLVGILVGGVFKGHTNAPSAALSPEPTDIVSASPTDSPSPSPSPSPKPSPSPSLLPDSAASSNGALINDAESGTPQSSAPDGIDCRALADAGWAVGQCQAFTFSDTLRKAFVVEHKAPEQGQSEGWRALVLHYSYSQNVWVKDLSFIDDGGSIVKSIKGEAIDLTRDGKPELVFGYRLQGTGNYLSYDIVTALIGAPTVPVHRELGGGHAVAAKSVITDYEARFGSKGVCCPVDYLQSQVGFGVRGWRIQLIATPKTAPAGDF